MKPTCRLIPLAAIICVSCLICSSKSAACEGPAEQQKFDSKVRLVEVTLHASDRAGNHVTDLRAEELTLRAGRRERDIRLFEPRAVALERFGEIRPLRADYRAVEIPADTPPRYYVILFHQLQYEFGFFQVARAAAADFIRKHMLPGDMVSFVCFDKYIDLEIDFTGDKQTIIDAVENLRFKFRNVDMVDRFYSYLEGLARRAADLPHKMSVILVAAGMFGVRGQGGISDYERAIAALQAADVRVFGVDARGLSFKEPGTKVAMLPPGAADLVKQGFNLGLYSEPTGGRFFRYHNNIESLLTRVDYEMSAYYVLGFYLDDDEDEREMDLKIETSRPGVKLRYKDKVKWTDPER